MKLKPLLFILYFLIWTALAINPFYRDDWILENILVVIALPLLLWTERHIKLSDASAWMIFIFLVLHGIGAHYTYSEMPWFSPITHFFGFERNHYDRLIHFLFGSMLFLPFYELFIAFGKSKRQTLLFTFLFLAAASGIYEVIEWAATELTHAELGTAFLGMQGDSWDTQKDMACGYAGSLFALIFWSSKLSKR